MLSLYHVPIVVVVVVVDAVVVVIVAVVVVVDDAAHVDEEVVDSVREGVNAVDDKLDQAFLTVIALQADALGIWGRMRRGRRMKREREIH